jgi:hypothetical protein
MTEAQDRSDFEFAAKYYGATPFADVARQTLTGAVHLSSNHDLTTAHRRCRFERADVHSDGNHLFLHCSFQGGSVGGDGGTLHSTFQGCTFTGVAFLRRIGARFTDCTFRRCKFGHGVAFNREQRMAGAQGLETCEGLDLVLCQELSPELERDLATTRLAWWCRWHSTWADLRGVGSLPFFGLSYTGVPLLLVLISAIDFYNYQAAAIVAAGNGPPLHRIQIPTETVLLLISGLALMAASTIYALRCPARIKEFSLHRWTEEFGKTSLHYLPLSWSRPRWRWAALGLYVIGGLLAAIVLAVRLCAAIGQLTRNIG